MTNKFQVNIHALDNFTPTFDSLNKQAQKAHETVSRVFTQLKKAGIIAEAAVNHIKILKPAALRHA